MSAAPRRARLALIGIGKMGQALDQLAPAHGFEVVARLDEEDTAGDPPFTAESLRGAEVAIEFTAPGASVRNITAAADAGCPIVVGTTGWYDALPAVRAHVEGTGGALLYAPNFSLGVNAFLRIAEEAARAMAAVPGFDGHLVETHHTAKKDAPSGTALAIAEAARRGAPRDVPITSIRVGAVPGTHELIFDAPFEQIRLEHVARDRRVFAEGALVAARWLIGRRGVFTMQDVLASPGGSAGSPEDS